MIGVVELIARDASAPHGPPGHCRAGFPPSLRPDARWGRRRSSDLYLFNDDAVAPHHANPEDRSATNLEVEGVEAAGARPRERAARPHRAAEATATVITVGSDRGLFFMRAPGKKA